MLGIEKLGKLFSQSASKENVPREPYESAPPPMAPNWQKDRGDWTETSTGKQFYVLDPKPEDVDIHDIAMGLAYQPRFNGQYREGVEFYSVAEHCCILADFVAKQAPNLPSMAFEMLMHDASEAYVGDMPRPVKAGIPGFREIEEKVQHAIGQAFWFNAQMTPPQKILDVRIMLAEREALMNPSGHKWGYEDKFSPLPVSFYCWPPQTAYKAFMSRFDILDSARLG